MSIVDELLKRVEENRRARRYEEMMRDAASLNYAHITDASKAAWILRSKVSYELHMAFYQRATETDDAVDMGLLRKSQELAERSAMEADQAEDPLGRLFAEMNIAGLIMPHWVGGFEEGMRMSADVCRRAEAIVAAPGVSKENTVRANQIIVNTHFHRIRMQMECKGHIGGTREYVASLLNSVRENPFFIEQKEGFWPEVSKIEQYINNNPFLKFNT